MSVDLDKHNERKRQIIRHAFRIIGESPDSNPDAVGRMMRSEFEILYAQTRQALDMVAGRAAALEFANERGAVEKEELIDKIERLEAVK